VLFLRLKFLGVFKLSTLTSANSAFALQISGLYPTPQSIQGYATDDAFSTDDVNPVEAIIGVDGHLSGGYTPYPTKLSITLQADSASNDIFDNWVAAQKAARETYIANATISLPGIGKKFVLTRGFLTSAAPMAGAKKTLGPKKFQITFESCDASPI
jgi:hypothetical protein